MVMCDHRMFIRYIDARHPGATHDSFVWNGSQLRTVLKDDYDRGDAGYPLEPYLITPYRSTEEGSGESHFSTKYTKTRNLVERAIGVLKNRFRCLLGARQLQYTPAKSGQIINVCAVLHNICLHYKLDPPGEIDLPYFDYETEPHEELLARTNDDELAVGIRNRLLNNY